MIDLWFINDFDFHDWLSFCNVDTECEQGGGSINIDMIFISGLAWLGLSAVVQQQNCGWIKSY